MEYRFRGQNRDEKVVLVVRRHPVVLLRAGYLVVAVLLVPWAVFVVSPGFTGPFGWTLIISLFIAGWVAFAVYFIWLNSFYIITDQRVIALRQKRVLARIVSEVTYDKVQEISHEVEGLYHHMLGIGHVTVRTAARQSNLVLMDVAEPYAVEQTIARCAARARGASV